MKGIGRATFSIAILLGVAALILAGCGSSGDGDGTGGESSAGASAEGGGESGEKSTEGLKVGVSNLGLSFPFPAAIAKGIKAEASKLGIEIVETDAQGKAEKQSSDVQDLIAQEPDGVLLIPVDGGVSVGQVQQLKAADIPVVAVASQVGDPEKVSPTEVYPDLAAWVSQDQIEAGEKAGSIALKEFPNGATTAIVEGAAGYSETRLRAEGFEKGLGDQAESFNVVANQPGNWIPETAEAACQNMLEANPEIELFYAEADEMGTGCANAVKAAGSKAKIIGIGGSELGLDAIKSGELIGTVCFEPESEGRLALTTLVEHLHGEAPQAQFVKAPAPAITRANLGDCDPQW